MHNRRGPNSAAPPDWSLIDIWHGQSVVKLHPPAQFLHRSHGLVFPQLLGLVIRHEDEIVSDELSSLFDAVLLRLLRAHGAQVNKQRLLDSEDGVRCLVRVVPQIQCAAIIVSSHCALPFSAQPAGGRGHVRT